MEQFINWTSLHWDNEEFPLKKPEPTVEVDTQERATVTYESAWASAEDLAPGTSASTGEDVYVIQRFDEGPVFSMVAEDWNDAFRSLTPSMCPRRRLAVANQKKRFVFVISITGVGDTLKEAWDQAVEAFAGNPEGPPDKKLDAHPDNAIDPNEYYVIEEVEDDEPEVTPTP